MESVNLMMTGDKGKYPMMMIDQWAPAYKFEKNDPNLFTDKDNKLLVAVLDPITIALHLHTYAEAAAQDCVEFAGDYTDQYGGRQSKVMMAKILQSLLAAQPDLYQDVHDPSETDGEKTWDPYAVDTFLEEYFYQINHRQYWRIQWHTFLVNWLDSAPFQIAFQAYQSNPVAGFELICLLLRGISNSDKGRQLLLRISDGKPKAVDDKWAWVSQRMFPPESDADKTWEMLDKVSGDTMGALKEWAPFVSTGEIPPTYITRVINSRLAVRLKVKPNIEIVGYGKGPTPAGFKTKGGTEYLYFQIDEGRKSEVKAKFEVGFAWVEMVLKVVSAAYTLSQIQEAFGPESNAYKKECAVVAAIHAVADLGAGAQELRLSYKKMAAQLAEDTSKETLETIEKYEIAASKLAAIAAITDFIMGVKETAESVLDGEKGEALGHAISTVGYGLEFAGALAGAMGIPGLGEVVMVGAFLVMVGNTIVKAIKKTDYQYFVQHCVWGTEYGESGPDKEWAVAKFEQWKGRYDLQLQSLIQLLCRVEIENNMDAAIHGSSDPNDFRVAKVTLGWAPIGVRIEATYEEHWTSSADTRTLRGTWEITDQNTTTNEYTLNPGKNNTLKLEVKPGELEISQAGILPRSDLIDSSFGMTKFNDDFQYIRLRVRLVLGIGKEELTIPYGKNKFKSGLLVVRPGASTDD